MLSVFQIYGQDLVKGKVTESNGNDLVGANVYWLGTTIGVVTDKNGAFEIERDDQSNTLVFSFTGFQSDTIEVGEKSELSISLKESLELEEVNIVHKKKTVSISQLDPWKTENVSSDELRKAACCSLSESFETNPSVDVSFTDAITGTKQIRMLGLSGPNIQISRENIPSIRGVAAIYGLEYIPGSWIESMQLNKGAGSVVNGYESIAGQINVELRKSEAKEKVFLNLYSNQGGMSEMNLFTKTKVNDQWSTAILGHARYNGTINDRNRDGFYDNVNGEHYIGMNRWQYRGRKGWMGQVGVLGTSIDAKGGQVNFDHQRLSNSTSVWGMKKKTRRMEVYGKIGHLFQEYPNRSMALQFNAVNHDKNSFFGLNQYVARQQSFYQNFIFQDKFGNGDHSYRTGFSFQGDNYTEYLNSSYYGLQERVPGVYYEYTYTNETKFSMVLGMRADFHNIYGTFYTPRFHSRYELAPKLVLRASAGKGHRSPRVIAENEGLLASSRNIIIDDFVGTKMESAWNFGMNLTKSFTLDYRDGSVSLDLYHTRFDNQIVVDLESLYQARMYNLQGESFSNSMQVQMDYELIKRLDVRVAYRFYDVQTTFSGELKSKPFLASHRSFMNIGYASRSHIDFDFTFNWQGQKRLPISATNVLESPAFYVVNTQIAKTFKDRLEVYLGCENLLDFRQDSPIINSHDPFDESFDAAQIWGPVFGRMIYAGLRFKIY